MWFPLINIWAANSLSWQRLLQSVVLLDHCLLLRLGASLAIRHGAVNNPDILKSALDSRGNVSIHRCLHMLISYLQTLPPPPGRVSWA